MGWSLRGLWGAKDVEQGYKAMQGVMGSTAPKPDGDFQTNWAARKLNIHLWKGSSEAPEQVSGCIHCGELQCVEEGPCGGAMCMLHCHACGREFYGSTARAIKSEHYGAKDSHFYVGRFANRQFKKD